ncbi:hypothetical protein MTP04_23470 [Lysinibacillus sp. PLM2]|nr:hypothetical protein MTP04_23470 [Lysinibacillus sp. PLM2]
MYDGITVERSLLYIEQHQVDKFKTIANSMKEYNDLIADGGLSKDDCWIIAFNIWLLLNAVDEHDIMQSAEKTIYYHANFIILNATIKSNYFKLFKREGSSRKLLYLASLKIANGINQWIYYVLERYDLLSIAEKNRKRSYFDVHLNNCQEVKNFSEEQALFVKASIKELKTTNSFELMLKYCSEQIVVLYGSDTKGKKTIYKN